MAESNAVKPRDWLPQAVASAMLLWAMNPENPYGYYMVLRWVCCGVFAYLAFRAVELGKTEWAWVLGITAGVYNPIVRVSGPREMWLVINLVTVGIALASIRGLRPKPTEHEDQDD
jgi:hypothetical protein